LVLTGEGGGPRNYQLAPYVPSNNQLTPSPYDTTSKLKKKTFSPCQAPTFAYDFRAVKSLIGSGKLYIALLEEDEFEDGLPSGMEN